MGVFAAGEYIDQRSERLLQGYAGNGKANIVMMGGQEHDVLVRQLVHCLGLARMDHELMHRNGSTVANRLLRVGGMATMPSRAASLEKCIDSIVSQVDLLYLYLDQYSEIPPTLHKYNNVVTLLPAEMTKLLGEKKHWGATGKFFGVMLTGDCLFFGFDDDIIYPEDYSKKIAASLARYEYRALVGIHGMVFQQPYKSYTYDRRYLTFIAPSEHDQLVDELGTGTVAFRTGVFKPNFRQWPSVAMCDLSLAADAHRIGLPRVVLSRPKDYLRPVAVMQEDSLWLAQLRDESSHNQLLQQHCVMWEQRIKCEFQLSELQDGVALGPEMVSNLRPSVVSP